MLQSYLDAGCPEIEAVAVPLADPDEVRIMTTSIVGCGYLGQRSGGMLANEASASSAPSDRRLAPPYRRPGHRAGHRRRARARVAGRLTGGRASLLLCRLRSQPPALRCGLFMSTDSKMCSIRLPRSVTRFVYASSTGVYGQTDGEWVDETSPTCPQHESGRVCLEAENRVLRWAKTIDCSASAIVLRFAGLYGPGRTVRRRSILERGEPIPGDPQKFLNLIHIDDAAQAAAAALDSQSTRARLRGQRRPAGHPPRVLHPDGNTPGHAAALVRSARAR